MAKRVSQADAKYYWVTAFVLFGVFLIAFFYGLFWGSTLGAFSRQMVILSAAAALSLVFLSTTAVASAEGEILGMKWRLGGSAAIFVILYVILILIVPKPETTVVRVYLEDKEAALLKKFTARARIRGSESVVKAGEDGETSFEVPAHLRELDVAITCTGYRQARKGPFQIVEGVVRVEMVKTESPPLAPNELPPQSIIPALPTRDEVNRPPLVPPEQATLFYRNVTEADVTLFMYSCSRHYRIIDENIDGGSAWLSIPIEASDEYTAYNNFAGGTGWFCFVLRAADGSFHFLGKANLFQKKISYLTIEGSPANGYDHKLE